MTIVSQSEYAAMRGVSRKTVTQWKKDGKLTLSDGGVDVEASDAYMKKYRVAGVTGNTSGNSPDKPLPESHRVIRPDESVAGATERILIEIGADMSIDEAKRIKENYLALLNQLEYDTKSGLVVLVSEVASAVGAEYAKVRTKLLAIPAEQAPRINRLKTVTEVQDALQELITEALEELTHGGIA